MALGDKSTEQAAPHLEPSERVEHVLWAHRPIRTRRDDDPDREQGWFDRGFHNDVLTIDESAADVDWSPPSA